ncbi:MAG: hypothetical protein RLZZ347_835 [Candidatus Parcubacteria bacterium]|jgi:hypothetical protein
MLQPAPEKKWTSKKVFDKNTTVRIINDPHYQLYQVAEVLPSGRVRLWTMPGEEIADGTYDPKDLLEYPYNK